MVKTMENPITMDDLGGPTIFGNTHVLSSPFGLSNRRFIHFNPTIATNVDEHLNGFVGLLAMAVCIDVSTLTYLYFPCIEYSIILDHFPVEQPNLEL